MFNYENLIEQLNAQLLKFEYTAEDETNTSDVRYVSYIKNPHPLKVRNLCALIDLPSTITENTLARSFFHDLRSHLLKKYGNAFFWKELEICFVVVCENNIYQILKKDGGNAVSEAGFYLSSMMGTSFIDKTTFDCFHHSSWGLYFSSIHHKAIRETVTVWCEQQNNIQ